MTWQNEEIVSCKTKCLKNESFLILRFETKSSQTEIKWKQALKKWSKAKSKWLKAQNVLLSAAAARLIYQSLKLSVKLARKDNFRTKKKKQMKSQISSSTIFYVFFLRPQHQSRLLVLSGSGEDQMGRNKFTLIED
jgi:hypothetical protein